MKCLLSDWCIEKIDNILAKLNIKSQYVIDGVVHDGHFPKIPSCRKSCSIDLVRNYFLTFPENTTYYCTNDQCYYYGRTKSELNAYF